MLPKFKKTPTKSLKAARRRPKKPSSPIAASIRSCRRRLLCLFSLLSPSNLSSHRHHGFRKLTPLPLPLPLSLHQPPTPPLPPPSPLSSSKPTLFLDLDETLVHSKPQSPPHNAAYDFIVYPKIDNHEVPFYVSKRPGVDRFLRRAAERFEVVVFTAGVREYASLVLDALDPEGRLISHSLYRDSCREVGGRLVKDLSDRGRDLGRVLIVDDNPNSYALQPENAVPVAPFVGDAKDRELERVMGFLESALVYEDIRDAVKSCLSAAAAAAGGGGGGVVKKM